VAEFYNVATSSCIDNGTFQGNAGAGSSVTTASTTPGASGELLVLFAFSDSGNATGWTIGSQSNITWMLLAAQADTGARVPGLAFQYGVYSSTAVISPGLLHLFFSKPRMQARHPQQEKSACFLTRE